MGWGLPLRWRRMSAVGTGGPVSEVGSHPSAASGAVTISARSVGQNTLMSMAIVMRGVGGIRESESANERMGYRR